MTGIPLQAAMEAAKKTMREALIKAERDTNLPPFLLASILMELRAEISARELSDLTSMCFRAGEEDQPNADSE